jgi:uncharacterized membrane protein YphA (DoxX/SURF4 family)
MKDRPMRARNIACWTTSILIAFAFISGGAAYLLRAEAPLRGMAELGYPAYFVTILGAWKLLGGLAILAPRFPRLKEWPTPASRSIGAGRPPRTSLGITAASWALRPASRRIV